MTDAEFDKRIKRLHDRLNGPVWRSPFVFPVKIERQDWKSLRDLDARVSRVERLLGMVPIEMDQLKLDKLAKKLCADRPTCTKKKLFRGCSKARRGKPKI